ncbi:hypothetical protein [Actinomadura latina]|uniref:Uncharacterized protein n=1 Tax=Actinomadura latina TaxID=163603 RepID=A0A846YYS7_9ACTN|nr:hypothetical protein [Actinomadura latina]NKZ03263.1 hypothetical protein [Actinomadura latina]
MGSTSISTLRRLIARRVIARGRLTRPPQPLAQSFMYPGGAGMIGPGAERLLRTVLVDALTNGSERLNVVIALSDLEQLLGDTSSLPSGRFASALHVAETLEDTIEHLESRHPRLGIAGTTPRPATLWLATPGPDADVVHQTLEHLPTASIIALFKGPWPYGPTHLIDTDGPRQLPARDLTLVSRNQAVASLHVPDTR